jgi:hypothetical protein
MSIYVGNLAHEVTQGDIRNIFAEDSTVKRVQILTVRETGQLRGFGFNPNSRIASTLNPVLCTDQQLFECDASSIQPLIHFQEQTR